MNRAFLRWIMAVAIIVMAIQSMAFAQGLFARKEQVIFSGDPIDPDVMRLAAWGGGWCEESPQNTYGGSRSIKVSPLDLYSGGRIDFVKPMDLTQSFNLSDAYLQVVSKFTGAQAGYDALTTGMGAIGSTDMYGGVYKARQVRRLRVMLVFEGGKSIESQVDLASFRLQDDGWMIVSFPLAYLKSKLDLTDYRLERMVISGDGSEPFHVGEISITRDSTPITPDAGESKEVSRNYPIAFQGFCRAGATAVKYSWDFNDLNGIQEEAVGDLVYHKFTAPGNWVVTMTASDVFGIKKSAKSTIKAKVNE